MDRADILLPVLVVVSAVVYGLFVGKAQAGRLRGLQADLVQGKARGFLVLAVVIGLILVSLVL